MMKKINVSYRNIRKYNVFCIRIYMSNFNQQQIVVNSNSYAIKSNYLSPFENRVLL